MKIRTFIRKAALIAVLPLASQAVPLPFQTPTSQDAGTSPRGLAVGSLLGNGSQQLAVANFGSHTFIGLSTPVSLTHAQDSTVQVFGLNGSALSPIATIPTAQSPRGLAILDAQSTGKGLLFVTAYEADRLQVFQWGRGSFRQVDEAPTLKMPVGVAAGRTRRDGTDFVAVADYGAGQVSLFPLKDGKLGQRTDIPVPGGPVQLAVGDLTGDGSGQIAVVCMNANQVVILSASNADPSSFAVTRTLELPPGGSPSDLHLADLNGDGRSDLVLADFTKNNVQVFLQQADGSLDPQLPLSTTGQHPNGLTVADLDGDKDLEILVANRDSDTIDVFDALNGTYALEGTLTVAEGQDHSFGPVELAVMKGQDGAALVTTHMRTNSLKVVPLTLVAPTPTPDALAHGSHDRFSDETTYFYPNPARGGSVKLHFDLPGPSNVSVQVFDLTGTLVWDRTLPASATVAGENSVDWDLTNQAGQALASGSYIGRFTVDGVSFTRKLAVIH
ncbi:MAG TPA: FG-GAP-like repeat-containing protein [bacterium]|nr:FG-GAP-like repeat-containing protein [bacterium]